MNLRFCTILIATVSAAWGQGIPRRASITGGGSENRGKCTIEVVVDGAAEVSIRGDNAILSNLRGQMPQWRRFECTGVMPASPLDLRFQGVDGRGSQSLVRDPRSGGAVVVQIQDSDNGTEGYTFDIFWGGGGTGGGTGGRDISGAYGGAYGGYQPDRGREDQGRDDRFDRGRGDYDDGRRTGGGPDTAIRNCQDAIAMQAAARYRVRDLIFRRVTVDNGRGARDTVHGFAESRQRRYDFEFSCAVDLRDGDVRGADLRIR